MIVHVAEYLAWIISALLGAWMVFDAVKVSREHDEDFLTTSVEGTDELLAPPDLLTPPSSGQLPSRTEETS
jgi:hypothetical protein